MSQFFNLFSNCIPVLGYKRSIICDVQMGDFEFIPNELYYILNNSLHLSVTEIKSLNNKNDEKTIDEYFAFLISKEFGFWDNKHIKELSTLSLKWDSPQLITNAIIDIDNGSDFPFQRINEELNYLNCSGLELRFYSIFSLDRIHEVLQFFSQSTLRSIYILIQFSEDINASNLELLSKKNPRLVEINVSNSEYNNKFKVFNKSTIINFMTKSVASSDCCGIIKPEFFGINIELFSEGNAFNTCLNRKISIDVEGNIKNCPSMKISYGNINETQLIDISILKKFKEIWNIKKDEIEICKDCEFRYICTDCRAFTNGGALYSKPRKCDYDPYSATWKNL